MEKISVILPCKNEEKYIYDTLESLSSISSQNFIEFLIADGRSSDNTLAEIYRFENNYPDIQVCIIDNPEGTVPYALNYCIERAKGDVIIRVDSHSVYPKDYINKLVYYLNELNADNVGGLVETVPFDNTAGSKAIAYCMGHKFGVGNSYFRIGINKITEVDTVPFGCFKKVVFDAVGLFDTDLVRNQDDEFNARMKRCGKKIYLVPDIVIKYYARSSIQKLSKMFYQYGYFKPLVNRKLGSPATLRQFAPPLFVVFIVAGFFVVFMPVLLQLGYLLVCCFYLLGLIYFSIQGASGFKEVCYRIVSFFTIHLAYGFGYLRGLLDFSFIAKKSIRNNKKFSLSR